MNFLALDGANFDIKPHGSGTFKAAIDLSWAGSCQYPMRVTMPRCAVSLPQYFNQVGTAHPDIIESDCFEKQETLALFTYKCCNACEVDNGV